MILFLFGAELWQSGAGRGKEEASLPSAACESAGGEKGVPKRICRAPATSPRRQQKPF